VDNSGKRLIIDERWTINLGFGGRNLINWTGLNISRQRIITNIFIFFINN